MPVRVEYVEGNVNGKNYIDAQLMTYAKYIIRCNSAFSYIDALLNTRDSKVISDDKC